MLQQIATVFQRFTGEHGEYSHKQTEYFSSARILDRLVENGKLSQNDADHVRQLIQESGDPVDLILANLGLVAEADIAAAFAAEFNLPIVAANTAVEAALFAPDLNIDFLRARRLLPFQRSSDVVHAAIVDPGDEDGPRGLSVALQAPVSLHIITASRFESLFSRTYGALEAADDAEEDTDISADADRLRDMASEEPIIRLVNRIVAEAAEARASDIHIEPETRASLIRFRIDGVLQDHETLPNAKALAAVSRLKILAELDIAERRRPQDGRLNFPLHGRTIDIRVSSVPTAHGESLVLRLLDKETVRFNYDALGFSPDIIATMNRCLCKPNGIFLVTGPTGSGKTTTLYTALTQLADGKRKILTIEDPIEYRIAGVSQSQANAGIGLSFAAALRSFLRHDPDVMMVGEIRDLETAQIAIQAALTGHMVLSTLHTNDAPSAIIRLLDMGVDDFLLASTLNGVLGQRLVRTLCPVCKAPVEGEAGAYRPVGCSECKHTGFKGRSAIGEIIEITDGTRGSIKQGVGADEIATAFSAEGYKTLNDNGLQKVSEGLTTADEIARASHLHV